MHADARRRGALADGHDVLARPSARMPTCAASSSTRYAPGGRRWRRSSSSRRRRAALVRPAGRAAAASTPARSAFPPSGCSRTSCRRSTGWSRSRGSRGSNRLIADASEADRLVMGLLRACAGRRADRRRHAEGSPRAVWTAEAAYPDRRRPSRAAAGSACPRRGRDRHVRQGVPRRPSDSRAQPRRADDRGRRRAARVDLPAAELAVSAGAPRRPHGGRRRPSRPRLRPDPVGGRPAPVRLAALRRPGRRALPDRLAAPRGPRPRVRARSSHSSKG